MKTTLTAFVAGISLFSFTALSPAQYVATGSDGITASPKLRQMLDERKPVVRTVAAKTTTCPECRDQVTQRKDRTARGANKPNVTVVKHLCETCDTQIKTTGQGKTAKTVVQHSCDIAKAAASVCCR